MNQNPNMQPNNQMPRPQNNLNQSMMSGMPQNEKNPNMQQNPNNASQYINENRTVQQPVKKKKKGLSRELVTIIGVLAIVAILYFTYNYQLNKNLEIVSKVPVASERIKAGTKITEAQIKYIEVPASTLRTVDAVTSASDIIGKFVIYDTIIPENSFFYAESLSATDTAPNSMFKDLLDQEIAITINVDLEKTYGNSIMPGDVVDIYVDAIVKNSKTEKIEYITGPLVTGAKVLAVQDSSGNNVFADHQNKLTPAYFVFTLDSDIINTIRKAQKLENSDYNMSIYPVISGKSYNTDGNGTKVNNSQIVDLINNATIDIKENN